MVLKWLAKAEEYSAYMLFVSGVMISLYGVFMRYVLNMPPAWVTEAFEFLMVWSIFIGFGMALKDNRHIVVDLVYDKLPFGMKRALSVISNLLGFGYSLFMAVTGVKMTALAYEQQIVTIDIGMPIWISYLIMPIGMGLMALYFLVKAYKSLKGERSEILGPLAHEEFIHESKDKGGISVS